jgi:hypothetical protein
VRIVMAGPCGLLALATVACGGTDDGRRTEPFAEVEVQDPGSRPVLCSLDDEYDFGTADAPSPLSEDFELGSVIGGWYVNNDQCDECDKKVNRVKALDIEVPRCDGELTAKQKVVCDEKDTLNAEIPICMPVCLAAMSPNPYQKPLPADRIQEPRCGSQFAMHIKGGPLMRWGGVMGVQFAAPGLDAGDWEGISFWARVGPESRNPIRMEVSDKYTDDKVRQEAANRGEEDLSQYCLSDAPRDRTREGCDKFGVNRSLSQDWQFFAVKFEEMRQSGWGMAAPYLDKTGLRSVSFMYTTGIWDIWIDDLSLFRSRP